MRDLAKRPEEQKSVFRKWKEQRKLPEVKSVEDMAQLLNSFEDRLTIKADLKYAMAQSISLGHQNSNLFLSMQWCLLTAPSRSFFITSDCPVVLVHFPEKGKAAFGGGLIHPTTQVTFPLSPEVCLSLDYRTNQRYRRASEKVVNKLNRFQCAMAERFVLSNENTKQIREFVVQFAHTRNQAKVDRDFLIQKFEEEIGRRCDSAE